MGDAQRKRHEHLEEETRRHKQEVADLLLDKQIIEGVMRGKD